MSKLENILISTGASVIAALCGFFSGKSIYDKPAPAEVKSSAVREAVSTTTETATSAFTNPHHLPPGFWLEYDSANNRYRQCQQWTCGLFDYQTKEEAIARAWNWVRDNEREAKAKWEKVKP